MDETRLPKETRMGGVALDVADLDLMTRFYADVLLLEPQDAGPGRLALGRAEETLVTLRHRPDLPRGVRRSAGLYHTALLHPDAATLATVLASVAVHTPHLYTGAGEHLVSQAFYLDDPEGNGVELYVDRPRDTWQWDGNRVRMATLRLDPNEFLARHLTDTGRDLVETAPDARRPVDGLGSQVVGHVHLKVGSTERAKAFYVDALGFEVTGEFPGALFVSAGGYHHHMAMNTWESEGVGLRAPALGLGLVEVAVPDYADLRLAADRLSRKHVPTRDVESDRGEKTLEFDDPWGNLVRIRVVR